MIRTIVRFSTVAVAVLSASVLLLGHSKLEKTEPAANATITAPPPHVALYFSEVPDAAVSKMDIKGPSEKVKLVQTHVMGKSLMAHIEGEMADGLYTVSWQTAGNDGHPRKGEFAFTLKRR